MPLYTVRATLTLGPEVSRGDNTASMSHHFVWEDDDQALAEFPDFDDHFKNSNIADRFTCERGDAQHELTLYERDIFDARYHRRVASHVFTLADWIDFDGTLEFDNFSLGLTWVETPLYHHRRGAVLVIQRGHDERCIKRTYVGPCSAVYLASVASAIGVISETTTGIINLTGTLDDPPQQSDRVDLWRPTVADAAAEHVRNLSNDLVTGVHVIPSWKHAVYSAPAHCRASLVRADLRSRGVRGSWGHDYET